MVEKLKEKYYFNWKGSEKKKKNQKYYFMTHIRKWHGIRALVSTCGYIGILPGPFMYITE